MMMSSSSPNHDDLAHFKIPFQNILQATNNSSDGNSWGQLLWSGELIDIRARRFKKERNDREELFWTEISMLSSLNHKNIVSFVGFCDENDENIIITRDNIRGSLSNHLSDPMMLTWVRRLEISVGIAQALSYIHYDESRDFSVIHRFICSATILLNDDWEPKLSGFDYSMKIEESQKHHSFHTDKLKYQYGYGDPTYIETKSVNHKSDMYSFGIILFELLCGRKSIIADNDNKYLAPLAITRYREKKLDEIIDRNLWNQMDSQSFNMFAEIAYDCLNEERSERPNIDEIVTRLEKALEFQLEHQKALKYLERLKIPLKDIELATENFADKYCIGSGAFGMVYKAQLAHFDCSNSSLIEGENKCDFPKKRSTVAIKRIKNPQGEHGFKVEIEALTSCKHENIIALLGFCDEGRDHMILVYELASKGSLEDYLLKSDRMINLTWMQRLKICLDIAHGLNYIHTNTDQDKQKIIHRDIKSANILLGDNWVAKIADFGLSKFHPADQDASTFIASSIAGTPMYLDPEYEKLRPGKLNKKSDIYSFGVVLFEILTGKLAYDRIFTDDGKGIAPIARHHFEKKTLSEIVDYKIKKETDIFSLSKGPNKESLHIFSRIAYRCLAMTQDKRPSIEVVINELKKALYCQTDYEIWKPKLPRDYKEIIRMSKCPEIYSIKKKEELYNIFTKGILLQQDKVSLSFNGNGERNELVSATTFTYVKSCPHKWRSLKESRFEKVAEMSDISNLNIEIKTDTQLLSPYIVYGVYLVFKLRDSRKFSTKPMYVNLKYKKGSETLYAYFAIQRDKNWMMIELHRFLNQNEDVVFKFLLESLSSYDCGYGAIYVEGIEFRAIDKMKHDIGYLREVQQVLKSNFNVDQVQQLPTEEIFKIHNNHDELFWLGELNRKKLLVLSAKAALYKITNVDLFTSKPSSESRFQEVIQLLPQQVFYINCSFRSQMLSLDTEYVCYLVFKVSEEYQGLDNPVRVRDLLREENEDAEFFIYLVTPSPLNINVITRVPKQREDGWMEIQLWKFNSTPELKDDSLSVNMKFTSHEGMLSGVIVCGLEFRPM